MILNVEGSINEETVLNVKLHTPFTAKNWIRLNFAHLPPLPLHNGFDDAVTFGVEPNITSLSIPAFSSIEELVGILNAMRDNQNIPLMHVFYDGREFELCVEDTYPLVIHSDLKDFLQLETQMLVTDVCYGSALWNDLLKTFSHWNVYVKNLNGMFDGRVHSDLLAKVRDDGVIYGSAHTFAGDTRNLQVTVLPVQKDGIVLVGYLAKENFSLGLEFGL